MNLSVLARPEQPPHAAVAPALAGHEQIARAGQAQHGLDAPAQRMYQVLEFAQRLAEHGRGGIVHARAVRGLADHL